MATIKHKKVSAIADDSAAVAAGQVVPSDWNDDHDISLLATDIPTHDNDQHSVAFVLPTDTRLHAPGSDDQDLSGLMPKSLATAADMTLVSSGVGTWIVKTLAEFKTWLGLGSAAYTASTTYATAEQGTDARTPTTHGSDKHSVAYLVSGDAVVPNTALTPGTKTKITYDAKGLITGGADATAADVGAAATGAITTSGLTMTAANKLAGRATTGEGTVEEITLGTGLTMTGTTLNASSGGTLSSTTPAMNGTATVGVEAASSHGDHVHPTDTTLLPKSGGTMTGPIVGNAASGAKLIIKPLADSATALQITNAAGTKIPLSIDTNTGALGGSGYSSNGVILKDGSNLSDAVSATVWLDGPSAVNWKYTTTSASAYLRFASWQTGTTYINRLIIYNRAGAGTTLTDTLLAPDGGFVGIGSTSAPVTKLHVIDTNTTTGAVTNVLTLDHDITGTPAAGAGTGINLLCDTTTTASQQIGNIAAVWTEATTATRKSKLQFSTVHDGVTSVVMELLDTGTPKFPSLAVYADNTAALAGGLTAGMVYRTATGVLMVTY